MWFSLNGTTYQNNSLATLGDIGKDDTALLCRTTLDTCCRYPYTIKNMFMFGNWFFPNGSKVPTVVNLEDFYRTRDQSVIYLHRRRGGVEGIFRCKIPDSMNVTQTIYIGVYTASTGE